MALFLPSAASAAHDLKIYKAEAHVELEADQKVATVSCLAGDHAVDGMWRIDHADQDDYFSPNELIRTAVDVVQATPTADDTYSFSFEKNAIGRVQLKLWVTCLANQTEGGAHTHTFPSTGADRVFATTGGAVGYNTSTSTVIRGVGTTEVFSSTATACPSGWIVVSPGFALSNWTGTSTDPTPQAGRVFDSNYTGTSLTTWRWGLDFSSMAPGDTVDVTTTWRCLKLKVFPNAQDKHKLIFKHRTSAPSIPPGVKTVQLDCGDHYKSVVAGFTISSTGNGGPAGANSDFQNLWYLGMDPRIKSRAFRFLNIHGVTSFPVTLRAACLNYRTS